MMIENRIYKLSIAILVFLICSINKLIAQNVNLDTLKVHAANESNDSIRAVLLNDLAWYSKFQNLKESEKYCLQVIDLCSKINQVKLRSSAYNTLGLVYSESNDFERAIANFESSIKDKTIVSDKKGIATVKNNIGVAYKNMGKIDIALKYYDEALATHVELNNLRGQADTYSNLGVICREQGQFEKSSGYFNKALELRQKINDKNGIGIIYNNLSANATDQNLYKISLDYLYKAAKLFEEMNNKAALVTVYGNIARINKDLLNSNEAITYCKKAITLGAETGAHQNALGAYATLGDVYFDKGKTELAFKTYNKGFLFQQQNPGGFYEGHFHLGKGVCYSENKVYDKALTEITEAVRIARERKQEKALARALQKLAKLYVETEKLNLVKKPLDEAIKISKVNKYSDILELCYKTYSNYHDINKSEKASREYLIKANKLKDTIFTGEVARKFADMHTKYETEKKENEIKLLKQQEQIAALKIEEQYKSIQSQRYILLGLTLGLVLIVTSGYFYFTNQKLKEKIRREAVIRATEENERSRIAKDIHDELGSGLSKIMFLTEVINKQAADKEKVNASLKSVSETARLLIDNMRDLIWAMNPENTTLENLIVRIREYSNDYLEEFPIDYVGSFPDDIPDKKISNEASRNIYMIVKESLQNIVKHADADKVRLNVRVNEKLTVEISDNGKGFNTDAQKQGNGLKNLQLRSEAIKGKIIIQSEPDKGTKIQFEDELKNILKA